MIDPYRFKYFIFIHGYIQKVEILIFISNFIEKKYHIDNIKYTMSDAFKYSFYMFSERLFSVRMNTMISPLGNKF